MKKFEFIKTVKFLKYKNSVKITTFNLISIFTAHLLQIPSDGLMRSLTSRITETRSEILYTPLSIDQALDTRDAFAKALYSGLFNW